MTDIVERLRQIAGPGVVQSTVDEAANEIETLRADNYRLREQVDLREGQRNQLQRAIETLRADNKGLNNTLARLNEGYDKIRKVLDELGFATWDEIDSDAPTWIRKDLT